MQCCSWDLIIWYDFSSELLVNLTFLTLTLELRTYIMAYLIEDFMLLQNFDREQDKMKISPTWDSLQSTQLSCLPGGMYLTPIWSKKGCKRYVLHYRISFCLFLATNSFITHFATLVPEMFAPDLAPNGRGFDVVVEGEEEEGAHNGSRHQQAILRPNQKLQNLPKWVLELRIWGGSEGSYLGESSASLLLSLGQTGHNCEARAKQGGTDPEQ